VLFIIIFGTLSFAIVLPCVAVSYVDDCRDEDATATHLLGETDGYLAVFPRQWATHQQSPSSRRCYWTISVNPGRRINITWRVFPTPVMRYVPTGVSLLLDGVFLGDVKWDQTFENETKTKNKTETEIETDSLKTDWDRSFGMETSQYRNFGLQIETETEFLSWRPSPNVRSLELRPKHSDRNQNFGSEISLVSRF